MAHMKVSVRAQCGLWNLSLTLARPSGTNRSKDMAKISLETIPMIRTHTPNIHRADVREMKKTSHGSGANTETNAGKPISGIVGVRVN